MNKIQTPGAHTILGHPDSLFVLFFTEMWERFSYYGMRALLVLFLITEAVKGGWGWTRADATALYGWYTGLVYLTPILGGYIADRILGSRRAVVLGGFVIAAGHACLLFDTPAMFYTGLGLVVAGTGLFKPNISAIVGQLYTKDNEGGRDGGYTLFYMGVNSGAFFGILLCGYIGEKISWPFGFALAGAFMLLGAVQFYFAQGIFGQIGLAKSQKTVEVVHEEAEPHIVADRLKAICVFSFFTIFFWFAFEQSGGSMTIFAADYTDRALVGTSGMSFKIINSLITVIPTMILSWLLVKLFGGTAKKYLMSNMLLVVCMGLIWSLVIWMLSREFSLDQSSVPATWFGVLNSFFIVILAPMFSKIWEKYWSPSGPVKFGTGLILLGLGFAALSYGSASIPAGAKTASVSMVFLIVAYLFHTMGELCISPVGLSYISKLAPPRLLGLMFGVWYVNTAIANKLAGFTGSYIDHISETYSLSTFFLIFTIIPITAGLVFMMLNKWMQKKMHGIH
ncbi:peptide MFS transporter [Undibacterium sp. Jales W-56]|uniref:peptide MFS transporter n=1 Tax=Undibacterium sp. Jales W-56 TaxID=2897325 RepID=UPI0021D22B53|nr:peptide MFS transporter [Undibacterium sp. Jales W-56]MCU6434411.1 peptide MFS transporter [Undibacterium sp. Jales W-56]